MSDTPETDAIAGYEGNWDTKALRMGAFARKLERERDEAKIEAWADREDLESLEKAIKTHYEYYSGFAVNKNLSAIQMLDVLFKSDLGSGETQVLRAELEALKVKSRLFKSTLRMGNFARQLERERDPLAACHIWQQGHSAIVAERDELLNTIRVLCDGADVIVADRDYWRAEAERWRARSQENVDEVAFDDQTAPYGEWWEVSK